MGLSSVAAIALQGLREQAKNLETAASNIANADSAEYQPHPSAPQTDEGADIATEMLGMDEGELAYRANAAVFEAGADLWDILGVVTRD